MKNVFCLALLLLVTAVFAQRSLPQTATDVAPLLIGEKIAEVKLKSAENKEVSLTQLFSQKRTVLVFYRGGWCPYCNLHLAALAEAETELLDLGYQIVAISPYAPNNLKVSEEK